jgi:hypothetical protein
MLCYLLISKYYYTILPLNWRAFFITDRKKVISLEFVVVEILFHSIEDDEPLYF